MSHTQRNSNIELLRIIAMLGIILQHCVAHNTVDYKKVYATHFASGIILEWSMLGRLGVAVFIIIFGFFSIKQRFKISRCIILGIEVWTYSIASFVILVLLGLEPLSTGGLLNAFFPLVHKKYWFISAYLVFYFFTPFLNSTLNRLTRKQFKYFITLQLILWCIIRTLSFNTILIYCNELEEFLLLYSLGAYLQLWTNNNAKEKRVYKILIILGIALYAVSPIAINIASNYIHFFINKGNAFFYRTSLPTVMIAYGSVGIMKSISVKSNRIINYIAGTTFGIYLFHFSISFFYHRCSVKRFFPD